MYVLVYNEIRPTKQSVMSNIWLDNEHLQ